MSGEPAISFYRARVFHARLRPIARRFAYRVLTILVDIDRLDEAGRASPAFSVDRFNILGFCRRDHGARDGASPRPRVEELCARAGAPRPARVRLLCAPRVLGHVFNPLSVYFCSDGDGRLRTLVYEVRNTFGGMHFYVADAGADAEGRVPPHECDKGFHVSPFMDMAARYRFSVDEPRDSFSLRVVESDGQGALLTAIWRGERLRATVPALLALAFDTPLAGFKTILAIHWQALLLWLGGVRLRERAAASSDFGLARPLETDFRK